MNYFYLKDYQQGPHELWKNSYNEPIRLKGNTDTIKLRLSHEPYSYDYNPIELFNEYGERIEASAKSDQKTVEIKATGTFIKGRPYYIVVPDNLLGKKGNDYDSIGRNVIITFIVE